MKNLQLILDLSNSTCNYVTNRIENQRNSDRYVSVHSKCLEIIRKSTNPNQCVADLIRFEYEFLLKLSVWNSRKYELLAIEHALDVVRSISLRFK